ncbi:MAG: fused MFS/spermidine synthase [Acidobacteriia bacterium]|nr:fused MFS/spermidine synthase [Terriglobia bacterium]
MLLYTSTVFLSAFLLFQIQPMIAKMILAWFGGSSSVWSTCMLFFQVVLLFGYAYAHWLQGRFAPRWQAVIHTAVLAVSLLVLPIAPGASWKPAPGDNPSLRILGLLTVAVGLPYFVVSTTSSLIQAWYARTHSGEIPYRLFALSNFASLLALLTYPLVVEPRLSTRWQANVWSIAYAGFAILCAAAAWMMVRRNPAALMLASTESDVGAGRPPVKLRILWVSLAACASILLLAATTFLTQDVAAIPFLWILPLAVYLFSFILCFNAPHSYSRPIFIPLAVVTLALAAYWLDAPHRPALPTIIVALVALFAWCMFCHGELVRRKPHPSHLTGFYLMISLGGAAGGIFVGLIAPNCFNAYYEFPIGLAFCAALVVMLAPGPTAGRLNIRWFRFWRPALVAVFCGYAVYLGVAIRHATHDYLAVERNFYGQLRVRQSGNASEEDSYRMLVHGRINHGEQMLNEKYRRQPVTYFCPSSGIGKLITARSHAGPLRVGVMGMGCGTLVAYGRPGDSYRIYEINPLVPPLAETLFTYLKDTPAKVEIALGDARLSLEREPNQQFDLLVMDAFSGDSVPVHLVTREAFQMYLRHLKPGGLLAVNVTNTYLDLRPVMERAASYFGKIAIYYDLEPDEDDDSFCFGSDWVAIADPSIRQTAPELVKAGQVLAPRSDFRMWTDDFSSMWGVLR